MHRTLLAGIITFGLIGAVAVLEAKPPPKTIVLDSCQKKKPAVTFPHQQHMKDLKIKCKECHHKGKPGTSCSAAKCHAGKAEGDKPGCAEMSLKKNPFHINCVGCHKKKKKGPKTCNACHKK
jgi:hypothetical protein